MAARSLASLSLSFGLVHIPVKLYSATESSAAIRFTQLAKDGSRLKQQYVSVKDNKVVERSEMLKGYEFEKDQFVLFTPEELKALEEDSSHVVDIVAFVPEKVIDPIYYDKAYFLAPDKRGAKPYNLLLEAMRSSGRCALARWSWKTKQYVVQIRPAEDGLVLQQLLYAVEVRSLKDLDIERTPVAPAELQLALQLIDQISQDTYDPAQFVDEERNRVLAAIDEKIAGKKIVTSERGEAATAGNVVDMMEALKASLAARPAKAKTDGTSAASAVSLPKVRKGAKRAAKVEEPAPVRQRARK